MVLSHETLSAETTKGIRRLRLWAKDRKDPEQELMDRINDIHNITHQHVRIISNLSQEKKVEIRSHACWDHLFSILGGPYIKSETTHQMPPGGINGGVNSGMNGGMNGMGGEGNGLDDIFGGAEAAMQNSTPQGMPPAHAQQGMQQGGMVSTLSFLSFPSLPVPSLSFPFLSLPCLSFPCLFFPCPPSHSLTSARITRHSFLFLSFLSFPLLPYSFLSFPFLSFPFLCSPFFPCLWNSRECPKEGCQGVLGEPQPPTEWRGVRVECSRALPPPIPPIPPIPLRLSWSFPNPSHPESCRSSSGTT